MQRISNDVRELGQNLNTKMRNLKEDIIKEVCREIKGKVVKTWEQGTKQFYNEAAKSIVSEFSRSPSVTSEYGATPRSRSASKDFIGQRKSDQSLSKARSELS